MRSNLNMQPMVQSLYFMHVIYAQYLRMSQHVPPYPSGQSHLPYRGVPPLSQRRLHAFVSSGEPVHPEGFLQVRVRRLVPALPQS